jgi:hypothetical protein
MPHFNRAPHPTLPVTSCVAPTKSRNSSSAIKDTGAASTIWSDASSSRSSGWVPASARAKACSCSGSRPRKARPKAAHAPQRKADRDPVAAVGSHASRPFAADSEFAWGSLPPDPSPHVTLAAPGQKKAWCALSAQTVASPSTARPLVTAPVKNTGYRSPGTCLISNRSANSSTSRRRVANRESHSIVTTGPVRSRLRCRLPPEIESYASAT